MGLKELRDRMAGMAGKNFASGRQLVEALCGGDLDDRDVARHGLGNIGARALLAQLDEHLCRKSLGDWPVDADGKPVDFSKSYRDELGVVGGGGGYEKPLSFTVMPLGDSVQVLVDFGDKGVKPSILHVEPDGLDDIARDAALPPEEYLAKEGIEAAEGVSPYRAVMDDVMARVRLYVREVLGE